MPHYDAERQAAATLYGFLAMLETPLRAISHGLQELQRASAGIGRVRQLVEPRSRIAEPESSRRRSLPQGPLAVRFDRVTFAYKDADR